MLRIVMFAGLLLINPAIAAKADPSYCGPVSELAAARLRWAAVRRDRVDPHRNENNCRAYGIHFYEAVTARQAVSICRDGIDHGRDLGLLDSEIDAFNDLIAAWCGG